MPRQEGGEYESEGRRIHRPSRRRRIGQGRVDANDGDADPRRKSRALRTVADSIFDLEATWAALIASMELPYDVPLFNREPVWPRK